ncbi:MAG: hypothetical protein HQK54_18100, partial [Oligoflexales bacterium]|nr:hypothetical protein [Oligoflexales bacterium]
RISYIYNFTGPSESIDTACSSSLVALHRAIQSIRNGDCDAAIVGGVNVIASPLLFISFSKLGLLSKDGRCKSFDKDADGYARSEGVGTILIKPYSRALADGDRIYALIRGSAENHGGRVSSLTVPNPIAQAKLIEKAWERSGVDPTTATYIEASGTGTLLGDSIEINGLKKAFKELYRKRGKEFTSRKCCGIGTVKSNIGHLETAGGMAAIIKVIQAMRFQEIPGNLHLKELNPEIDLDDTPFYIVDRTQQWEALKDADNRKVPRRAGISAFGFGGSNAHVVIEEHKTDSTGILDSRDPVIITLSARTKEVLRKYAKDLSEHLEKMKAGAGYDLCLSDVAYTLQIGRERMEERLAVITDDICELKDILKKYGEGGEEPQKIFTGNVKRDREKIEILTGVKVGKEIIYLFYKHKDYESLARLWVFGADLDFTLLYKGTRRRRISLPTYPFDRKRYWIPEIESSSHRDFDDTPRIIEKLDVSSGFELLASEIRTDIARLLKISDKDVDLDADLSDYGLDSVFIMQLCNNLNGRYMLNIMPSHIAERASIKKLTDFLLTDFKANFDRFHIKKAGKRILEDGSGHQNANMKSKTTIKNCDLSFEQKRMWNAMKINNERNSLTIPLGLKIEGPLEISHAQTAINAIISRHDTLRTIFREKDGEAHAVIMPDMDVPISFFDFSEKERRDLDELKKKKKNRVFDI